MPEIEIEIYCSCGNGLCSQSKTEGAGHNGGQYFIVEPCEKCLEIAEDQGYDKGIEQKEE